MRICLIAANAEDDLLVKNYFIFQGTMATFCRWYGQICNLLAWNLLWISCTKIIKIGLFLLYL